MKYFVDEKIFIPPRFSVYDDLLSPTQEAVIEKEGKDQNDENRQKSSAG